MDCTLPFSFPKILGSLCFTVSPLGSRQISSPAPKLDVEGLPLVQFKGKVYVLKGNNDEYKFQKEISELCKSGNGTPTGLGLGLEDIINEGVGSNC